MLSSPADSVLTEAGWPHLILPEPPAHLTGPVKAWRQRVDIITYLPHSPDIHPMFLERRVYQGSSGRVYPLPFYDRVATEPSTHTWDAIHIENEFLRIMILPEIGGRIHVGYDKRSGYDFFYRQNVIRPALVGLAGPWISGGVEFNWPQHHRPATFMPTHSEVIEDADGSVTVWCSDHDPMQRMKGMHGVCLHPGSARLDVKVRLYNRTPLMQTFLWWANVATRVHEKYQSFFPTDVAYVADHAKRAVTTFPLSDRPYYGVDYARRSLEGVPESERPSLFVPDGSYAANDLSWYANIPVPTSYMITRTEEDFFGGYDHAKNAGVVHVANHHIVPGKKQWTWGNHEFGYAWDRSLTHSDGPYIELMAGAYTDNQPDFSYLSPWETKSFTQSWFPIFDIGVPQVATVEGALRLDIERNGVRIGVQITRSIRQATLLLRSNGELVERWSTELTPSQPWLAWEQMETSGRNISFEVLDGLRRILFYDPASIVPAAPSQVATEPDTPSSMETIEELYLTGLHLEQYRHATRSPLPYWLEALRRDPHHSDSLNALGLWRLRHGEFTLAIECFQKAIARLTSRNPNPRNGEPFYNLGLAERYLGNNANAYRAFYKATWNAAWRSAAYLALAEIDCTRDEWDKALEHLDLCLKSDTENMNARNLRAHVLSSLSRDEEAAREYATILLHDPLDLQARWHRGSRDFSGEELLDMAFDFARAGRWTSAENVLLNPVHESLDGTKPTRLYALAWIQEQQGESGDLAREQADALSLDYCFPSRLEEQIVLQAAIARSPFSASPRYLLGLFCYDKLRYTEAIELWKEAATLRPAFSTVWRNLGIALFNIQGDPQGALDAFEEAYAASPSLSRIVYERDQLWKRTGRNAMQRLEELQRNLTSVQERDDLSAEYATMLNQLGRPDEALELLLSRPFQPWEGGEGVVLNEYVRSSILSARQAASSGNHDVALDILMRVFAPPHSLNEAKHLLANWSHVDYWLGVLHTYAGHSDSANYYWRRAAEQRGDFQQMSVLSVSSMTFWTGLAQLELGAIEAAESTFLSILERATRLSQETPRLDYFATSLPTMLLFEEDLKQRNRVDALFLKAQALLGMALLKKQSVEDSVGLLKQVLTLDPSHAAAADLIHDLPQKTAPIQ